MKEKRLAKVETHLNSTLCLYSQRYLYPCGRKLLLYRPYFTLQHKTKKLLVRKKKKKKYCQERVIFYATFFTNG